VFFGEWWLIISAKPLFIGSIPIAASIILNLANHLATASFSCLDGNVTGVAKTVAGFPKQGFTGSGD
jgi:hypothetical protein